MLLLEHQTRELLTGPCLLIMATTRTVTLSASMATKSCVTYQPLIQVQMVLGEGNLSAGLESLQKIIDT